MVRCHFVFKVIILQCWNVAMWKPHCSKVDSISKLASQLARILLLPEFTTSYLGTLSGKVRTCGCTAQLSKAEASLQPTICLGHGLQTLAHSSCGHSCSVGALGKLLRPMGVTVAMAWVCVSPCLARSCWGWTVTAQQAGEIQLEKGWWCGQGFLGRWHP